MDREGFDRVPYHSADLSCPRPLTRAGDDADKVFYAATGQALANANDVAKIIADLIPGASIRISDVSTPFDDMEASFRGILSITNAREQLGWTPKFTPLRAGIIEYISRYRDFLASKSS